MIGGFLLAESLQAGFDPVEETISALAATTASAPGVMTAGLAVTGVCHVITALGLRGVPRAGRVVLAVGGVATAAVAALPVDVAGGPHGLAAGVAFAGLSLWPLGAWRREGTGPLRREVAWGAAAVLTGLLVWFVLELQQVTSTGGALTGASERVVAGAQAVWPLVVVLWLRRLITGGRAARPPGRRGARTAKDG
ncbi:DUF998 domain-containing protein [Actinotalea sp. BY-33]|uniref:DUF998 domain-containing protein n=2 Tax=Actinotalea soli TaxID=2819234 RepID=A0A939RVK4_9CELL|nr:DUF998 domain-containing protein [Actinotalea soli]